MTRSDAAATKVLQQLSTGNIKFLSQKMCVRQSRARNALGSGSEQLPSLWPTHVPALVSSMLPGSLEKRNSPISWKNTPGNWKPMSRRA